MGRPRRIGLLLLAAALLAACSGTDRDVGDTREPGVPSPPTRTPATSAPTPTTPAGDGALSVRVTTEREAYGRDETITFTVETCNLGPATTTEGGGGSDTPFSFQVLDGQDAVVADDSHAVRTMELRTVPWAEGQCRSAEASWDQHYWNRAEDRPSEPPEVHGTPQRGDPVPPGAYRIRVTSPNGTATSDPFQLP